jgi:Kyakuja-Dileera-Zisupton transposase
MLDYDISCSWIINFLKRVAESNHLSIPDIDIIAAVGKFHLGAHVAKCFCQFLLNFIQDAGQHNGKIIETLWPAINKISPSI